MNIITWIDILITYGWPAIFMADITCFMHPRLRQRYIKGKLARWWLRQAPFAETAFLLGLGITAVTAWVVTGNRWGMDAYWLYIAFRVVYNLATGGDDPGKRVKRWLSEAVKKLKMQPAPKPAIDLG